LRDAAASERAKECKRERARGEREREKKKKLKDEAANYVKEGNHVNSKKAQSKISMRVKKN
jgi:hypothetical protein